MTEFENKKQEKERGYSVQNALDDAKDMGFNQIMIAGITKDMEIDMFYSFETSLGAIGVLEVLKDALLDEMKAEGGI